MLQIKKITLHTILLTLFILILNSCGAVTDFAEDSERRWGFINKRKFVSPLKLTIGVAPIEDQVGLGNSAVPSNTARLLEEELIEENFLIIVSHKEIEQYMAQAGLTLPLDQNEALQVSQALNLNAIVLGSINELSIYNKRKNWRRALRFMTSSQEYVLATLNIKVIDASNGVILAARANVGDFRSGAVESDPFENKGSQKTNQTSQESIENSLDLALEEASNRILDGLAYLPFKASLKNVNGNFAEINFGSDNGLKMKQVLPVLQIDHVITNTIGQSYQVYGQAKAKLKIVELDKNKARLEVIEGSVSLGDLIQIKND